MDLLLKIVDWLADSEHWAGPSGIPMRLAEHIGISVGSLAIAAAVALPIGLWIGHTRRGVGFAINLANLGRAVPSLAAIGIAVPFTQALSPRGGGFDIYPTVIAMVVLAIPPILVNAYAGIAGADPELVEAARGLGLRERQVLTQVEIPVAIPIIVGGLRSATVQVIATATLGSIYGFGGFGSYLVLGVAQRDDGMLFGGVILVAALAVTAEAGLALVQRQATSPGLRRGASSGAPATP